MTETTLTSREAFTRNALASAAAIEARRTPAERAADPTEAERKLLDDADEALEKAVEARQAVLRDVIARQVPSGDGAQFSAVYMERPSALVLADEREANARVGRIAAHEAVADAGRRRRVAAEARG